MLMLAPCNPDPTAGQHYPTFWPVGVAASAEVAALANFMRAFGYPSAFVVNATGDRSAEIVTSYFRGAAKAQGIRIAGDASVAATTNDLSSLAARIKSSGRLAGVFTAAPPPFVNRLGAALRAQGVDRPVIGPAAMDTPLSLSAGGAKTLENAFFTSYGFPREDAAARRFARDYSRRFHRNPVGSFPGLGLETVRLLAAAVRKAGSAEPAAIQRALAGGVVLSGEGLAERVYERGGNHNPVGQIGITKIGEGALQPLAARTP
jgi:branched-chain amino acid transport system substrate-binding protein